MTDQFVISDFGCLSSLVRQVLFKYPVSRDDDLLLCFFVWKFQGLQGRIKFSELSGLGLSKPESISRCRRVIQNDDMELLGDRKVERINREKEMREHFGGIKSE